jgi:hypothetical protein
VKAAAFSVLAAVLLAGCLDSIDALDPKVGEQIAPRCVNEDSDRSKNVSFSKDILPILKAEGGRVGCGCHQPGGPNPIGFEETKLDLSSHAGIRAGGINTGVQAIVPGQPCESILWQKISPGPPFGGRMPLSGPPFLPVEERKLIADWIAEGAVDN